MGFPVGTNLRRIETWKSIIEKFKARLSSWKARHISLGGRVVLINAVLSNLPVYFLSPVIAPKSVLKKLTRIQRLFLWGGSEDMNKISWMKWDVVCKPKSKGGLGVRNLEVFNLSLLGKWKWRLLNDSNALWWQVVKERYGEVFNPWQNMQGSSVKAHDSFGGKI